MTVAGSVPTGGRATTVSGWSTVVARGLHGLRDVFGLDLTCPQAIPTDYETLKIWQWPDHKTVLDNCQGIVT